MILILYYLVTLPAILLTLYALAIRDEDRSRSNNCFIAAGILGAISIVILGDNLNWTLPDEQIEISLLWVFVFMPMAGITGIVVMLYGFAIRSSNRDRSNKALLIGGLCLLPLLYLYAFN